MLTAFRSVVMRANLNQHHNIQREALSVRERMSNLLAALNDGGEIEFLSLFTAEEGRAGCVVSFLATLELCKESLVEIFQEKPFAPIFLRPASATENADRVNFNDDSDPDSDYA